MNEYINAFKNYANFSGKATRRDYWMFVLIQFIIILVLNVIDYLIGMRILSTIYGLIALIPALSLSFRRLHDIGKSGVWILIVFLPIAGAIWYIILLCKPSKQEETSPAQNFGLEQ